MSRVSRAIDRVEVTFDDEPLVADAGLIGLEHCPSGRFFANAAWLGCAVLAHNLIRWTARLGDLHPAEQLTVARTVRVRLLQLPGRLVNRSRQWVLRLPARWPWATTFNTALGRIRSLPLLS